MHGIGGFSSFSSGRVCRHCTIFYNNLTVTRSEEDCVVRTRAVHKFQVQFVLADSGLKSVYGVTGECCLSCLHYFDPVSCLPPVRLWFEKEYSLWIRLMNWWAHLFMEVVIVQTNQMHCQLILLKGTQLYVEKQLKNGIYIECCPVYWPFDTARQFDLVFLLK